MKITIEKIAKLTGIDGGDIVAVYPYGSRVYGTHSESSDYDYIVVYSGSYEKESQQYDSCDKMLSAHTHSAEQWQLHIDNHKIFALECLSIADPLMQPSKKFSFKLDKAKLRAEISSKSSNSWVKCKKKLEVEDDYVTGIKSLFHSFRMPKFGIQIAKYGKIVDFSEANNMWFDGFKPMISLRPSWRIIKDIYQPQHNQLMSEFRSHAEKN